ncbi:hypothetical protein ALC53_05353, partial [Atta colombica]
DEFLLFSILYYSYLLSYKVCIINIVRASTRYKNMSEYFRRSYVHEWRFAFTVKSGTSTGSTSVLVTEVPRRYNGRLTRTCHKWKQKAFCFASLPMASFRWTDLSKTVTGVYPMRLVHIVENITKEGYRNDRFANVIATNVHVQ